MLSVIGNKSVDLKKVRQKRLSEKPKPLYRKIKQYRLLNQIPKNDVQTAIQSIKDTSIKSIESEENSEKSQEVQLEKIKKSKKSKDSKQTEKLEKNEEIGEIIESKKHGKIKETGTRESNTDLHDDMEYIIKEVDHLEYSHRKEVLNMIVEQAGAEMVYESSDGSRIDLSKLPVDIIIQIKNFVVNKLKTIDITNKFDSIELNSKDDTNKSEKPKKSTKSEKPIKPTKTIKSPKQQKTKKQSK